MTVASEVEANGRDEWSKSGESLCRLGLTVARILGSDERKSGNAPRKLGLPRAYSDFGALPADGGGLTKEETK